MTPNISSTALIPYQPFDMTRAFSDLTALDLSFNFRITKVDELVRFTSLKVLNLSWCINLMGYSQLSNLNHLQSLELAKSPNLTSEDLSYIAKLTNLTYLDISFCRRVTEEGISHLSSLKKLQSLFLINTVSISSIAVKELQCKLPMLQVNQDYKSCWVEGSILK